MSRSTELPDLAELGHRLEEHGIPAWHQGEELLATMQTGGRSAATGPGPLPAQTLLCAAEAARVLDVLPRAVVTAPRARRLTFATRSGPVDLLPLGDRPVGSVLLDFGLGPLALARRLSTEEWCDPLDNRAHLADRRLEPTRIAPNPFAEAPRRYWIAARLLGTLDLEASPALLVAAREALPDQLEHLPRAAPARRAIHHLLFSSRPANGLSFLRRSGVTPALFPGTDADAEARIARLAQRPIGLRWAAWLHGTPIQQALVQLRMPWDLARSIERLDRMHPIDEHVRSFREVAVRRILQRLSSEEVEGLFAWRRLELAEADGRGDGAAAPDRLEDLRVRLEEARRHQERSGRIRKLALDGAAVMRILDTGPGPRVGRALAHLANFVEAHPDANVPSRLEEELRAWAGRDPERLS
ncbi:MAG TPA: hypothetical protein ENI85_18060 [Deltaproteobacteria bacterium]|nr:hypothetical protein [Deltaproteobacteria bacterium]